MENVKASGFDVGIVHKLDRLTRSQCDLSNLFDGVFKPNGVNFMSVTEGFDPSTASGKLALGIMGTVWLWEAY